MHAKASLTKYHALTLGDITIRQDDSGRYCLNDLHRAAGGAEKDKPNRWLRSDQTKAFIDELSKTLNRASEKINDLDPVKTVNSFTEEQGTFVVKELVYAYAMWISAAFHLQVIRAYDAMVTGSGVMNPATLTRLQLIEIAMQAEQERLQLVEKVEILEPKADALDRIATRSDGSMCITDAAKTLQVQPKALFAWLQAHQWIYRRAGGSGFVAYQHRIQCGLLEHKVTTIERSDGSCKTVEQALVTAKGLAKLSESFQLEAA